MRRCLFIAASVSNLVDFEFRLVTRPGEALRNPTERLLQKNKHLHRIEVSFDQTINGAINDMVKFIKCLKECAHLKHALFCTFVELRSRGCRLGTENREELAMLVSHCETGG